MRICHPKIYLSFPKPRTQGAEGTANGWQRLCLVDVIPPVYLLFGRSEAPDYGERKKKNWKRRSCKQIKSRLIDILENHTFPAASGWPTPARFASAAPGSKVLVQPLLCMHLLEDDLAAEIDKDLVHVCSPAS